MKLILNTGDLILLTFCVLGLFLCNMAVPDNYPPEQPKGANGSKQYE